MNSNTNHIVLFDDVCVLCNSFAKFIINKDKKDIIRFSALQSQTAVAFRDKLVQQIDSIVLIENSKKIYYKSDAVIKIFAILNYPTWFCKILEVIPKSIRDFISFPKNNQGKDIMLNSPSPISREQLEELSLKLDKPKKI